MAAEEGSPAGPGCLGMIVGAVVLAVIIVLAFFVGIVVLGVVAALLVIGLLVFAVDRVLVRLSPRHRARREAQSRVFLWQFGRAPSGEVIDATAVDTGGVPPRPERPGPDEVGPG